LKPEALASLYLIHYLRCSRIESDSSASQILFSSGQHLEAPITEAYAFHMSKKPKASGRTREGQLKLVALLLYIADQKQKSLAIAEQLFSRLMLPRRN